MLPVIGRLNQFLPSFRSIEPCFCDTNRTLNFQSEQNESPNTGDIRIIIQSMIILTA